MGKNNGGSAFPAGGDGSYDGQWSMDGGMSLRDAYAMTASEDDIWEIIKIKRDSKEGGDWLYGTIGIRQKARYIHADAMLAAREGK